MAIARECYTPENKLTIKHGIISTLSWLQKNQWVYESK